jgi:hypothetical protein
MTESDDNDMEATEMKEDPVELLQRLLDSMDDDDPAEGKRISLLAAKTMLIRTINKAFDKAMNDEWLDAGMAAKAAWDSLTDFGKLCVAQARATGGLPTVETNDGVEMVVVGPDGQPVDPDDLPDFVAAAVETIKGLDMDAMPDNMVGVRLDGETGAIALVDDDGNEYPLSDYLPRTGEAKARKKGNPMPGGYL